MWSFKIVFTVFFCILNWQESVDAINFQENEACYSYAGGSVYPAGSNHAGHQLHTTKAVSKFKLLL